MHPIKNLSRITRSLLASLTICATVSTASAAEDGWVTLIDGTEGMENFNIVGDANWSAENNAIQATQGSGASWLVSKQNYSDFSLRVEFWASDDANSGIYMRSADADRITD